MTPGFARPRSELPWLPYESLDRVIINAHNFNPSYLYPSLRTTPPTLGYYARLDAGAAATDQFTADGAQNGTLTNGVTRVNNNGLAYSFTDSSSMYIGSSVPGSLSGAANCTLAFWAKKSASGKECTIGTRISATSGVWLQWFTDGFVYFSPRNGSTTSSGYNLGYTSSWVHLAAVKSGTSAKIYVNGAEVAAASGMPANLPTLSVFNIGRLETGGFYSDGLIDDPVVYGGVALDAANIGYLASQRGAIYATA